MPLPSIFKLYYSYIKVTDINLPFLSHQRKDGTGIWYRVKTGGSHSAWLLSYNDQWLEPRCTKSPTLKPMLLNCLFVNQTPLEIILREETE